MTSYHARNLVTGGSGFVGSHLVDRLMEAGEEVICLDNYFDVTPFIGPGAMRVGAYAATG